MKISVAMAYYNGGTYIEEQMDSILSQLGEKDEVIVSIDGASDGSKPLLLSEVDSRIHIVKGPGKGVVRNFENAIRHCNGDIIYLSDQDDIWKPDKVEKVNYAFSNPEVKAVLHDAEIVDDRSGKPFFYKGKPGWDFEKSSEKQLCGMLHGISQRIDSHYFPYSK